MNSQPTNNKPLIMAMDEAEKELIATINQLIKKHSLPCYVFNLIFEKAHEQLKQAAQAELATASAHYAAQCKESKEGEET